MKGTFSVVEGGECGDEQRLQRLGARRWPAPGASLRGKIIPAAGKSPEKGFPSRSLRGGFRARAAPPARSEPGGSAGACARRRPRDAFGGAVRRGAEEGGAAPPDADVLLGACSGASGGLGDDAEPLTKRHIDGIFTDSYSRYRKQMAVKKYLAAVLGKRYKQRVKNKGRRVAYL
ncbi:pituitary adenylate cyclase-activating polypeptide [Cyanistes caeruleus]|uniref:pituitary adenylate cyclase-activating polypeptide n=1 Tax=Cyanistes caeruleus TaxID=156563 RepID=UPI000CDB767A|nr:pituitary adenylate cyclase-activating polypeptide [Cyanistes caeruleus]